jgi:putative Mn2+ efflux pump MntP
MDQLISTVTDLANALLPLAISLGVIGVVVGLAMSVIGYRHGSDVMRTSVIGMVIVLAVTGVGNYFKSKLPATGH